MDLFVASTGLRLCERAPKSTVHGSQTSYRFHSLLNRDVFGGGRGTSE